MIDPAIIDLAHERNGHQGEPQLFDRSMTWRVEDAPATRGAGVAAAERALEVDRYLEGSQGRVQPYFFQSIVTPSMSGPSPQSVAFSELTSHVPATGRPSK